MSGLSPQRERGPSPTQSGPSTKCRLFGGSSVRNGHSPIRSLRSSRPPKRVRSIPLQSINQTHPERFSDLRCAVLNFRTETVWKVYPELGVKRLIVRVAAIGLRRRHTPANLGCLLCESGRSAEAVSLCVRVRPLPNLCSRGAHNARPKRLYAGTR